MAVSVNFYKRPAFLALTCFEKKTLHLWDNKQISAALMVAYSCTLFFFKYCIHSQIFFIVFMFHCFTWNRAPALSCLKLVLLLHILGSEKIVSSSVGTYIHHSYSDTAIKLKWQQGTCISEMYFFWYNFVFFQVLPELLQLLEVSGRFTGHVCHPGETSSLFPQQ